MSMVRTPNRSRFVHIRRGKGKTAMAHSELHPKRLWSLYSPFLDGTQILEATAR